MAVYTSLSEAQIGAYCKIFGAGVLAHYRPIAAGTINSVFDVATDSGRYVLRVLEDRSCRDATFEVRLLAHLKKRYPSLALVAPLRRCLDPGNIKNRPHLLALGERQFISMFPFIVGTSPKLATARQLASLGENLAYVHLGGSGFRLRKANRYGASRMSFQLKKMRQLVIGDGRVIKNKDWHEALFDSGIHAALTKEKGGRLTIRRYPHVGWGIIHSDLFRDNTLFIKDKLQVILDFEMACSGPYMYDLAVVLLDWCFSASDLPLNSTKEKAGQRNEHLIPSKVAIVLQSYAALRPISKTEQRALAALLRYVSARFTLTRIATFEMSKEKYASTVNESSSQTKPLNKSWQQMYVRFKSLHNKEGSEENSEAVIAAAFI